MKISRLVTAMCIALACSAAQAGNAYTVRPTDLKEKPFTDAKTLATLPGSSKVEVVQRRGSWNQIKAGDKTGWVKMLSLRLGGSFQAGGDTGVRSLFNVASTGRSGSMMTTGVRGLSEEKLHNPQPNPQAFAELHGYAVDKASAQRFAAAGSLKAAKVGYLPAPAK